MPINSITRYSLTGAGGFNQPSPATSGTLTIAAGDLVIVFIALRDDVNPGTLSISNSGTAMSWTALGSVGNMRAWVATAAETENRTVSVAWTVGSAAWAMEPIVLKGQHLTDSIPAGNIFTSSGGATNDVSLTFTPSGSGSAYFGFFQDMSDSNSFTAGANCTITSAANVATHNTALIEPTTNPRTDANNFTLAESDTTTSQIHYIAFEVRAPSSGQSQLTTLGAG